MGPADDTAEIRDMLARYERGGDPRKLSPAALLRMALRAARALPGSRETSILATNVEHALAWDVYRRSLNAGKPLLTEPEQPGPLPPDAERTERMGEPLDPVERFDEDQA